MTAGGAAFGVQPAGIEFTADQIQESILSALAEGNREVVRGLVILLGIHYPAEYEQFKAALTVAQMLNGVS